MDENQQVIIENEIKLTLILNLLQGLKQGTQYGIDPQCYTEAVERLQKIREQLHVSEGA